jgi:excisionase family DNA binding protein
MQPVSKPPLVYTVEQAAELLAIGRTAAYEAVRRGDIPSVRIGRAIRCPRHALEQLLNVNDRTLAHEGPERIDPPAGNGRAERMRDVPARTRR